MIICTATPSKSTQTATPWPIWFLQPSWTPLPTDGLLSCRPSTSTFATSDTNCWLMENNLVDRKFVCVKTQLHKFTWGQVHCIQRKFLSSRTFWRFLRHKLYFNGPKKIWHMKCSSVLAHALAWCYNWVRPFLHKEQWAYMYAVCVHWISRCLCTQTSTLALKYYFRQKTHTYLFTHITRGYYWLMLTYAD